MKCPFYKQSTFRSHPNGMRLHHSIFVKMDQIRWCVTHFVKENFLEVTLTQKSSDFRSAFDNFQLVKFG
jgi:hypothetical protein